MMSTLNDIYDPPPAPVAWAPKAEEGPDWSARDLAWLVGPCAAVSAASAWAWASEPTLGLGVTVVGIFVIFESWLSAVTFLHRHPADRSLGRHLVFAAALVPWLLALGSGVLLMMGLFAISDWVG